MSFRLHKFNVSNIRMKGKAQPVTTGTYSCMLLPNIYMTSKVPFTERLATMERRLLVILCTATTA